MELFNSPRELLNAYRDGFEGGICDPEETAELLAKLKTPLFGATAYRLYGSGEGKLSLPAPPSIGLPKLNGNGTITLKLW